jgi:hypothetical protein
MELSYFHIFIRPKTGVTDETVKSKMDLAVDWFKYSEYCWVVKSTSSAAKWQTRLKPLAEGGGVLLIFKVDLSERQGWIAKGFWTWLRGEKPSGGDTKK